MASVHTSHGCGDHSERHISFTVNSQEITFLCIKVALDAKNYTTKILKMEAYHAHGSEHSAWPDWVTGLIQFLTEGFVGT